MKNDPLVTKDGLSMFLATLAQAIREIEKLRTVEGDPVKVFRDRLRYLVSCSDSGDFAGDNPSPKDLETLRMLHASLEVLLGLPGDPNDRNWPLRSDSIEDWSAIRRIIT